MKNNHNHLSLELIIEKMPGNVWWKDKSLHYLGCNAQVLDLVGLSKEEFIGKTDQELWSKQIADNLLQADQHILATGETISLEEVIIKKDGTQVIMLTNKSPYFDENNHIAGIIGTATDITYRKQAEEAVAAANQAKAEFLENMRHDIRTPLVGITGCAHAIKDYIDDPQKTDQVKEYADMLITSGIALTALLNEILETIRITTGEVPFVKRKFDLKEKLLAIIDLNQAKARQKNLKLTLEHDMQIPQYLIGDPNRIQSLVLELVTNALNFTDTGSVKLSTKLSMHNEKDVIIKIIVADTGIGISDNKQQEVFTHFKRLMPSYKSNYLGAGLGLTLVKQFIDDLEGEIYLESTSEKGSQFTCVIPIKEALLDEQFGVDSGRIEIIGANPPICPTQVKAVENMRILLVEDQPIAAKVTKSLFTILNCVVDVAQDGQSAFEYAKNNTYGLILMDIGLPDMNGFEVTKKIHAWELLQNKHTPIVAVTAHVGDENKEQYFQAGINEVLSKPLSKEKVLYILNTYFPYE